MLREKNLFKIVIWWISGTIYVFLNREMHTKLLNSGIYMIILVFFLKTTKAKIQFKPKSISFQLEVKMKSFGWLFEKKRLNSRKFNWRKIVIVRIRIHSFNHCKHESQSNFCVHLIETLFNKKKYNWKHATQKTAYQYLYIHINSLFERKIWKF